MRPLRDPTDPVGSLILCAPVYYKGRPVGMLMAWVDQEVPLGTLAAGDQDPSVAGRFRLAWTGEDAPAGPGVASVPGTAFRLLGQFPPEALGGPLSSRWFLAALAVLALVVLGGGWVLPRMHSRNLVLETRMESAARQRQELRRHNERLLDEMRKREDFEQRLVYQTNYDGLTGLPNRSLAMDRLTQAVEMARREGYPVLVMYLDLDRFKHINDALGHALGDGLLMQVAVRLRAVLRRGYTVARLGGDEFLLLFTDPGDARTGEAQAEAALATFARPFEVEGRELFVTASIGVAIFPGDGDTAESLLKHADIALYGAKDAGRGVWRTYAPALNARVSEDMLICSHLRRAAERNELSVVYQPVHQRLAQCLQRPRGTAVGGRLRHRLFGTELSQALPLRCAQDRRQFHRRPGREQRGRRADPGHCRDVPCPGADGVGRVRRDPGPGRDPHRIRLRPGPGLLLQPAPAPGGVPGAPGRGAGGRGTRGWRIRLGVRVRPWSCNYIVSRL